MRIRKNPPSGLMLSIIRIICSGLKFDARVITKKYNEQKKDISDLILHQSVSVVKGPQSVFETA